jgi:hypothetical protein
MYIEDDTWQDECCSEHSNKAYCFLKINNIKIPLCFDCLNELKNIVNEEGKYCYKCKNYRVGKYGYNREECICKLSNEYKRVFDICEKYEKGDVE